MHYIADLRASESHFGAHVSSPDEIVKLFLVAVEAQGTMSLSTGSRGAKRRRCLGISRSRLGGFRGRVLL